MPMSLWAQTTESDNQRFASFRIHGGRHYNERQIRKLMQLPRSDDKQPKNVQAGLTRQQLGNKLRSLLNIYRNDGYLAAAIDSVRWTLRPDSKKPVEIFLSEGDPFLVNQLTILGNRHFSSREIRQSMRTRSGSAFKSAQLEEDVERIIGLYAEDGYLLVKVNVEDLVVQLEVASVEVILKISEGDPVLLKEVEVAGNFSTKTHVITRELGLREKSILTRSDFARIPERLRRLPYLELTEQPRLTFAPDSTAVITLSIREENSSQFSGIVGFNPEQGRQDAFINGLVDLSFQNLLGTGRSFLAYWEKRGPSSQSLRLGYEEPWLLGWPVNGMFGLEQIVQDTSYVRRSWGLGFKFFPIENISVILQMGRERVLPDSAGRAIYQLPKSRADRLLVGIALDSRNHPWNPSAGLMYRTSIDFIRKRIDPLLPDEARQRKEFERVSMDLEYLLPLYGRQVLMFGLHGRKVSIGGEVIPVDELFRIGGAGDLRGYREDQFLGSQVAWGTLEYRMLLDRTSRLGFFLDGAYVGRRTDLERWERQYRIGYGFGIRTRTDLGIIGFDYALGKGDNLSQGKIHIRLINTF
jgi:outer membrane protein assembly factor BamA